MEETSIFLILIVGLALALGLTMLFLLKDRSSSKTSQEIRELHLQMKHVGDRVATELGTIRLNVDTQVNLLGNVQRGLGDLSRAAEAIHAVGKDIAGLENLLRPPKFRGQVGELLLERLLEQAIPKGNYRMQYSFGDGRIVDAMIFLGPRAVPVDSKFPLESFERVLAAKEPEDTQHRRREFDRAIRKHIDNVSGYIRPKEGTFDFSLMYVPAENVFYEMVIQRSSGDFDLCAYAQSKKVIPVSPNTLYLYLQSIALGLTGLELQGRVEEVWAALSALDHSLSELLEGDFPILGRHLGNAQVKYDDSRRKLENISRELAGTRRPSPIPNNKPLQEGEFMDPLQSKENSLFDYSEKTQ